MTGHKPFNGLRDGMSHARRSQSEVELAHDLIEGAQTIADYLGSDWNERKVRHAREIGTLPIRKMTGIGLYAFKSELSAALRSPGSLPNVSEPEATDLVTEAPSGHENADGRTDALDPRASVRDGAVEARTIKVKKAGQYQILYLPREFHFARTEVEIFRRGDEIILRQKRHSLVGAFDAPAGMQDDDYQR